MSKGFTAIRELVTKVGPLAAESADFLVLPLIKDDLSLDREAAAILGADGGPIRAALDSGDFKGDPSETLLLYGVHPRFTRVCLVGVGSVKDLKLERLRAISATVARRARDLAAGQMLMRVPLAAKAAWSLEEQLQAAVEGALLGTWQFPEYKTVDREKYRSIGLVTFLHPEGTDPEAARSALHRGRVRADGTLLARDLTATPANVLTPAALARAAEALALEAGLKCSVLDGAACEQAGMGAFLSVARGSAEPPQFIVLEYECGRKGGRKIGLVGKAITFDAGGISIKPALGMHEMKYDMAGGAAVLGAMKCLRALDVPVNVIAAIPAAENLPGGRATRPGDVVRSVVGKTVEVLNTDAEGRLILADALGWLIRQHKPDAVIDLATLTGAVVIALGHYGAALLSNHEELAARIEAAAQSSGERVWRLPIWDEYPDHLKGETADLKNIADANAGGGTIAGGAFLREFVEETPWAHVDIAATAFWDKDRPHLPKGPSGYGVRLLLDLLEGYRTDKVGR